MALTIPGLSGASGRDGSNAPKQSGDISWRGMNGTRKMRSSGLHFDGAEARRIQSPEQDLKVDS